MTCTMFRLSQTLSKLLFVTLLLYATAPAFADEQTRLDDQYAQIILASLNSLKETVEPDKDLDLLVQDAQQLPVGRLLARVNGAQAQLHKNPDSDAFQQLFSLLLERQLLPIASRLFDVAQQNADSYTLSRLNYLLAVYQYNEGNIASAQTNLKRIEIRNALSQQESDYATLLFGLTLQHERKHRAAVKYYTNISAKSPYYAHARLNIAVAYIRQGWWTDAKLAINDALDNTQSPPTDEMYNRLLLVLGYNQLQNAFYRDARDVFRKVTLDSQYSDRALLGIGLCALNQGDYIGAINAFSILKEKSATNISVTEAHLLFAYAHEQMGEKALASAQYEAAIAYYNQRILQESQASASLAALDANAQTAHVRIENTIMQKQKILNALADAALPTQLHQKIGQLKAEYTHLLQQEQHHTVTINIELLTSYLSQAQYGQAKLFDTFQ